MCYAYPWLDAGVLDPRMNSSKDSNQMMAVFHRQLVQRRLPMAKARRRRKIVTIPHGYCSISSGFWASVTRFLKCFEGFRR